MSLTKINSRISETLSQMETEGRLKGKERIIEKIIPPQEGKGYRFNIVGYPGREFLKMDSNSYLGLNLNEEMAEVEHIASKNFGVGPGAVRFIDGTFTPHIALEKALANFHNKQACQIFSSAYSAVCGVLAPLINEKTLVVSDELNHNCIINSLRLAKVSRDRKLIFPHLNYEKLKEHMLYAVRQSELGNCDCVIIVTDGIFSMRGDFADLVQIDALANDFDEQFKEGIITVVDDSHGVAAYGETGRGTTEVTKVNPDILIGTLGKGFGVNGGYVVSSNLIIKYLRETSPFYIYSNPITSGEAAAALKAVEIVDSNPKILQKLKENTEFFKLGIKELGFDIIPGIHPIVAMLVGDTKKTKELVSFLFENNILVIGLGYPIVPRGYETIRFQVSAIHTKEDLQYVLNVLEKTQ